MTYFLNDVFLSGSIKSNTQVGADQGASTCLSSSNLTVRVLKLPCRKLGNGDRHRAAESPSGLPGLPRRLPAEAADAEIGLNLFRARRKSVTRTKASGASMATTGYEGHPSRCKDHRRNRGCATAPFPRHHRDREVRRTNQWEVSG